MPGISYDPSHDWDRHVQNMEAAADWDLWASAMEDTVAGQRALAAAAELLDFIQKNGRLFDAGGRYVVLEGRRLSSLISLCRDITGVPDGPAPEDLAG